MVKKDARMKVTFTIDKELWRKFRVKATTMDKKYSEVLEELVQKCIEK